MADVLADDSLTLTTEPSVPSALAAEPYVPTTLAAEPVPTDKTAEAFVPTDGASSAELSPGAPAITLTGDAADAGHEAEADRAEEALFQPPSLAEQERMVEAILFASAEPITVAEMNARMPQGSDAAEAVRLLEARYAGRGVILRRIGDAWAFRTAGDLSFLMQREVVETRKLSRAAIETLAIIAYHQPVTRAEIEEIRGVAVSRGTIDQLLELDWIRFGRRKMSPGRPVTFVVTEDFLDHFGLANARDLPGLKDLRASGLLEARGLAGTDLAGLEPAETSADPDEADQPDPAQGDMFGA